MHCFGFGILAARSLNYLFLCLTAVLAWAFISAAIPGPSSRMAVDRRHLDPKRLRHRSRLSHGEIRQPRVAPYGGRRVLCHCAPLRPAPARNRVGRLLAPLGRAGIARLRRPVFSDRARLRSSAVARSGRRSGGCGFRSRRPLPLLPVAGHLERLLQNVHGPLRLELRSQRPGGFMDRFGGVVKEPSFLAGMLLAAGLACWQFRFRRFTWCSPLGFGLTVGIAHPHVDIPARLLFLVLQLMALYRWPSASRRTGIHLAGIAVMTARCLVVAALAVAAACRFTSDSPC